MIIRFLRCVTLDIYRYDRHSSDPLVHHGRHFGRTVYAMCNVRSLITNSVLRLEESDNGEIVEESLTSE